jgi:alkylation response protein AidB-like acyl-CoA dehydrogenase
MNYFLTEEQQFIKEIAQRIAKEKVLPLRAKFDETQEFPWEIARAMAESNLTGIYIEEKYGGTGGGVLDLCIAVEELSRACGGISLCLAATALATFPLILFGSEEQKKRYLPQIASGERIAAFALTESGAGSDAGAIQTTAREDGDSFILNGTKQWITNGGEAELYTVIAMTDKTRGSRGASAFIVEKGMSGFEFGKKEDKMGIRASATRELVFEDCRVPAANLLGKKGQGFMIAMRTFDTSRPGVAAQAVGIAQGALDEAVAYARQREQFGKPIISFQGIQFMLADMATQVEAARALVYAVARAIDSGEKKISKESAMAKIFASDVAMRVTIDAVQILGGYGYMKEYPVEKMMRDAKITQIYEGTNQIQRTIIASNLIKEEASKRRVVT